MNEYWKGFLTTPYRAWNFMALQVLAILTIGGWTWVLFKIFE